MKGEIKDSSGKSRLRSVLVVVQFAASVGLIICTATVQKQLHYIKSTKLGYNREQVLVMRMRDRDATRKFDLIKRDLLESSNFVKVTSSGHLPINVGSQTGLEWTEREGQEAFSSYQTTVDYDFIDVFEIELVEGRNFSRDFPTTRRRRISSMKNCATCSVGNRLWANPLGTGRRRTARSSAS